MSLIPRFDELTDRQARGFTKRIDALLAADDRLRAAATSTPTRNGPPPVKVSPGEVAGIMERGRTLVQVSRDEYVYRPDGAHSYVRDIAAGLADPSAQARLRANNRQYATMIQRRAGVTQTAGAGGEFVPPVWLVQKYAPQLRAGRPFLNALGTTTVQFKGNQLDFPAFTSGGTVAVQTDGSAPSNTDPVTAKLTAQVQTEAGRTVASYQVLDLNSQNEEILMRDLLFAFYTSQDRDILAASNVANAKSILNMSGTNSVTYTDASPTAAEFWSPVSQAAAKVGKVGVLPDFLVTSPAIGYFILGGSDTTNLRPLYVGLGSGQTMMGSTDTDTLALAGGPANQVGNVAGIPMILDPNMPVNLGAGTNESRIVVMSRFGLDVFESTVGIKLSDQSANLSNLQSQLVAWGYWASVSRQPAAVSVISGTGLIPNASWS